MFNANQILRVWVAPRDGLTYGRMLNFYKEYYDRFMRGSISGIEMLKNFEFNRRLMARFRIPMVSISTYKRKLDFRRSDELRETDSTMLDAYGPPLMQASMEEFLRDIYKYRAYGNGITLFGITPSMINQEKYAKLKMATTNPKVTIPIFNINGVYLDAKFWDALYYEQLPWNTAFLKHPKSFASYAFSRDFYYNIYHEMLEKGMDSTQASNYAVNVIKTYAQHTYISKNLKDPIQSYRFLHTIYYKIVDKKTRVMLPVNMSIFLLSEFLKRSSNMSIFIESDEGVFHRITGMVSSYETQNRVMIYKKENYSTKVKAPYFVYSCNDEQKFKGANNKFYDLDDLEHFKVDMRNLWYGPMKFIRRKSEMKEKMYGLILESKDSEVQYIDAYHGCFRIPNYNNLENLKGKIIEA